MKIKTRAQIEASSSLRTKEPRSEDYGPENVNPRGRAAKDLEMSIRRSVSLHNALMGMLELQGSVNEVKYAPMIGDALIDRDLKKALGDRPWRTPTWRCGWEWTVDHWWSGGIQRSIDDAMLNLPEENQKRVEKVLDDYAEPISPVEDQRDEGVKSWVQKYSGRARTRAW